MIVDHIFSINHLGMISSLMKNMAKNISGERNAVSEYGFLNIFPILLDA